MGNYFKTNELANKYYFIYNYIASDCDDNHLNYFKFKIYECIFHFLDINYIKNY